MQHCDVVIHTNAGIFGHDRLLEQMLPIGERIELSDQLWVGRLDGEMAKTVMDTCESKIVGAPAPWRQYAQLYAFVRELPAESEIIFWDTDQHLGATVALSRIIHPTFVGFAYAARISHEDQKVRAVYPAQIRGISREAFLSPNRTRDWLTAAEGGLLKELIPPSFVSMPRRIHNAFWHHEYAARTYYLDHKWTLVVTGLEALVHTDRNRNTSQFVTRIPQLASDLGFSISELECRDAYDLRSTLSHGASFITAKGALGPTCAQIQLYDLMEDILAAAILKSIRETTFAHTFEDDDRIRLQWPI